MAKTVLVRQNDTLPYLDYTLVKDSANTPHDLTGATIVFNMTLEATGAVKIDRGACTIVDAANGKVRYSWQAGDTDTTGVYIAEFEVTFPDGRVLSFPEGGYIRINIVKELG